MLSADRVNMLSAEQFLCTQLTTILWNGFSRWQKHRGQRRETAPRKHYGIACEGQRPSRDPFRDFGGIDTKHNFISCRDGANDCKLRTERPWRTES